jgi:hypothetical protein
MGGKISKKRKLRLRILNRYIELKFAAYHSSSEYYLRGFNDVAFRIMHRFSKGQAKVGDRSYAQ